MHLPDQFLSNQTNIILASISAVFFVNAANNFLKQSFKKVQLARWQLQTNTGEKIGLPSLTFKYSGKNNLNKKIEQISLVAVFIFAMQMLNFPIQNGTSGHFLGGVLAAAVLGPWNGFLALASVLFIQAVVFSDGGLMALGANIFNMAIVGVFVGNFIYNYLFNKSGRRYLALSIAAWSSVLFASLFCALELAFSGTISLGSVLPAMIKVHALIGLGEALITILAIKFLFYESAK